LREETPFSENPMSSGELSRFDQLVSRYIDEELTPAEGTELVALLGDPPLARRFLEMTRVNSEIAGVVAAPVPDAAMVELVRGDIEKGLARESESALEPPPARPGATAFRPVIRTKRPLWPKLAWAAVFVVVAALATILIVKQSGRRATPQVASLEGDVVLVGPAGERVANAGEPWRLGEELRTMGAESTVTLKFADGSQLAFAPHATAINDSSRTERRVRLERGQVEATIQSQPAKRPFVFTTPHAECVVVGTALRLVAEDRVTRLDVISGKVRFRRLTDGEEITVSSGEYAVAAPETSLTVRPIREER
jgi:ferric-dicitrate binding protein FerR (iron transport regulator)